MRNSWVGHAARMESSLVKIWGREFICNTLSRLWNNADIRVYEAEFEKIRFLNSSAK
jgi:hypothetical protein